MGGRFAVRLGRPAAFWPNTSADGARSEKIIKGARDGWKAAHRRNSDMTEETQEIKKKQRKRLL